MTPKEKAEQLIRVFNFYYDDKNKEFIICQTLEESKRCALIAVDLAIEAATSFLSQDVAFEKSKEYWYNVKIEIVKMFGNSE